jgi:hypothetical protein
VVEEHFVVLAVPLMVVVIVMDTEEVPVLHVGHHIPSTVEVDKKHP